METLPKTFSGPGLVDIQVNGYGGFSFNGEPEQWTADDFRRTMRMMAARGMTAALPTFVTDDAKLIVARAKRYGDLVGADAELAAFFPRLHLEGPFISPVEGPRGAHPKCFCATPQDAPDLIDRANDASGGRVGLVTLAPELPGAIALVKRCAKADICVSLGHMQASNEVIEEAILAGARMSTHLGNGSHQTLPRLDNYVMRQLADDRLFATFIADGHHMPLTTLKNFIRAKTPQRSILISDAILAADMEPGEYEFGGRKVLVSPERRVFHPGDKNLAGSAVSLDLCVVNTFLYCDVTFEQAWAMASTIPAALLGLPASKPVSVKCSPKEFKSI